MKTKSFLKRALTLLLTLLMLLSTTTLGISAAVVDVADTKANVELAGTGVDHTGGYIYFLAPSNWTESYVMMFIGHNSYTSVYQMTKVSNTTNLYRYTMPSWGGATYVAFANASSLWGSGNWGPSNRTNATHYTNVYNNYGFNSGSYYVITPSGTANNANITITYKGTAASSINVTARADVYTATTAGGAYSFSGAGGTVKVSGYYMSSYSATSTRSAVASTASTAYASTTLAPGSKATFTATANSGYAFKGWYSSSTSTSALSTSTTYTYDLSSANYTVYAKFEKVVQNVTATFKDHDGTQIGSVQTIQSGQTPTPPANPTREGYTFTGWSPAVGAITTNTTYTAQYTINSYNVTATANPAAGGTVTRSAATVNHGGSVTLTATPDADNGYAFTGWNITGSYTISSGSLSAASVTITATSAINATASFQQIPTYTVKAVVGLAGAGTVSPVNQEVAEDNPITLTAVANTGYVFTGWTISGTYTVVSGNTSSASFEIIPTADVTATANFRANSATVKFQTSTGGIVTNSGSHTVTHPNSATSTATANTGYTFNKWEVTGGTLNTDYTMSTSGASITITPTKDGANLTATASFTINKYTVTFVDMNGEVIDTQTVEYGKGATAPTPPTVKGYTFKAWDKTFNNITGDITVTATYTPDTYTVSAGVNGTGGTAATSANSVTYPNTVTLTAVADSNYVFNGWNITGAYEVVTGNTTSTTFVIRPEADITAQATFVQGQYLTIHSFSSGGYNNLYLWEEKGTATNYPNGEWPGTVQPNTSNFNGVDWKTSAQLELTYGYSTEVGAILNDGGLTVPSGTGNLIMFNNTLGWSDVYLYTSTTDGSLWSNNGNGATTSGKTAVTMTKIAGTNYYYAYVTGTIGDTLFVKDKQDNYGNLWETSASFRSDYSSSNPMFTPSTTSNETRNNTKYYNSGSWGTTPSDTLQSGDILLTDYLYKDGAWAGVSEIWITQDGKVTLRRSLLDLVTEMTPTYNGGTNAEDYTDESWTAFVNAYNDAYQKSGAAATTQAQIDAAETALQQAFDNLEKQSYFTLNITQNGLGTILVDGKEIHTETDSVQIAQNKKVNVTITAPAGYYIKSVTGAVEATNQASPYSTEVTVSADGEIVVTYAKNPTISATQNGGTGSVTVNGTDVPVDVEYGKNADLVIVAPDLNYIVSVTINGETVYIGTDESKTNFNYTIENVTGNTVVEVTYATRTVYEIEILPYPTTGGTLSVNGVDVPATGTTIKVVEGDSVTITAKPNTGYGVHYWVVDNATGNRELNYTFSNVSANHTIDVEWIELQEVTVTAKPNPYSAGTATVNGSSSTTVMQYDVVELVATVKDPCYVFVNWTIEGSYELYDGTTRNDATVKLYLEGGNVSATANFAKVYRKIFLDNAANWSQPYLYSWGSAEATTAWPGDKMTKDSATGYWVGYIPMDATNIQFNDGTNQNQVEFSDISKNLYNNSTKTPDFYVEPGYYLQGSWNGEEYDAFDFMKFEENGDGTYSFTITVNSTEDGYIYVNPSNELSRFFEAATKHATDNPQTLNALGAAFVALANRKTVKVEIDTNNFQKAYDVTFTFNPTTREFSWTKVENVPTITIIGTDGRGKNEADVNMVTGNDRVGDTYFDIDTVNRTSEHTYHQEAQAVANTPVTFYTQVNKNSVSGLYDYYVAGWVVNGTEFVSATSLGNGLYSGSYVFTEDSDIVPVYFHTDEWLAANNVETVTVYAVADKNIENWEKYFAAYTWYKVGGTVVYEQFGAFPGQLMIPVAGLDGVYYTIIETSTGTGTQISGITFSNYAPGDGMDTVITDYANIQTYDYYEFIALLEDGKQNITFVIKDTNDTYNSDKVAENTNETLSQFDFVQYTDYSGLKTDIFGNNIEATDATLSDSNALYVIQAGDKNYSGVGNLDGQWYVDCYLYDATGKYLGKCYSYELHDEDSAIWDILSDYEGQRAYISYEHVNGNRYDGEWYGDADVSVTINLAVNVALTIDGGKTYTVDTTDPVNEADYGSGYINVQYQNVDVNRGAMVTITATPKPGYKFVGWYTADGKLFTTNTTYTIMAAVGTTYTAVFEELESGYFYVNHYIYQGIGSASYVPIAHGGNAVLYVGIDNITEGTKTSLLQGNSAYIAATEGDKLIITIATDATGADWFYSWYTDAVDKYGKTTFEEVGVDSSDNLWNNGNTVVGRNDIVYFQFEYTIAKEFSMNLYSDLMPVSVNRLLIYQYTDRYDNIKSYYVPYTLTAQEIEGFEGNNFTPYTPAYISGDGWVNTILANAPYVEDYYKDTTWIINDAMYDTFTFLLWATQPYTMYTVTSQIGADVVVNQVPYNTVLELDARQLSSTASLKGFWYNDVNFDGKYTKGTDIILTYGPQYGYVVTQDMSINYQNLTEGEDFDFNVSLDEPVYGREQTTDTAGNNKTDKVTVDYIVNILTPYFYGQDNNFTPIYNGNEVTENWNGQHVTIESLIAAGYDVSYGVILEQVGTFKESAYTYEDAVANAEKVGFNTASSDTALNKALDAVLAANKSQMVDGKYYTVYNNESGLNDLTNKNRLLFTISYNNNETNRGKFFNVYGYVTVTFNGVTTTYFSNVQTLNIYEAGTHEANV